MGLIAGSLLLLGSAHAQQEPAKRIEFLHTDHLGNVRLVTDESGGVVSRHKFLPYGEEFESSPAGASSNTHKFTGHERDKGTGLDYMMARYYSPETAFRFLSVDPASSSAIQSSPQSWNRYSYVLGNPLRLADQTGETPMDMAVSGANILRGFVAAVTGGAYPGSRPNSGDDSRALVEQAVGTAFGGLAGIALGGAGAAGGVATAPTGVGAVAGGAAVVAGSVAVVGAAANLVEIGAVALKKESNAGGGDGQRNSADQEAVIDLAKQAKKSGGMTSSEADNLGEMANEAGVPNRQDPGHDSGKNPATQNTHSHVGPVDHIPIKPDK